MIDWLTKLPEWAIAPLLVGSVWFGFNYAVLAERAMAKDDLSDSGPSCLVALNEYQSRLEIPRLGLGEKFGMPELDVFENMAREAYRPHYLSQAEKLARCECAVATSRAAVRFDYAVATSTFRIISPQSIGGLRHKTVDLVMSGACGALPRAPGGS